MKKLLIGTRGLFAIGLTLAAVALLYAQEPQVINRRLLITLGGITANAMPTGGNTGYGSRFAAYPVAGTAGLRNGAVSIILDRVATAALTAWDGNPDTGLNLRARNYANNTAGSGVRAIDASARNSGTSASWVKAFEFNGRNDSGKSLTDSLSVMHLRAENYGNIATSLVGLDVELSDENSTSDPHTKHGILIRNTDASGMGAVDAAIKVSYTSTNGFGALVDFDDAAAGANTTIIDQITSAATTAAYQIRVITPDGASGWINVYSTSGTGP